MIWEVLEHLDKIWTLAINKAHSPFTDQLWLLLSARKEWIPLYVIAAGLLIWRLGWKKGLVAILGTVLCILCIDQFANLIKNWAERLRPCNDPQMIHDGLRALVPASRHSRYGFFSAHAGNALGFAVCVCNALKYGKIGDHKYWKGIYTAFSVFVIFWAVGVGVSRIFVGKHFLGDILVGFTVGLIFAEIISSLAVLLYRRLSKQTT